ncbi:TrkH family potassium uptake protein [Kibdelosporangium aridum]|uniref:TrkH family potassium uptake protein n=1 Tax=Kibdelosporangium aridum TaxID=2030 RepID=UPI0035E53D5E
MASVKGMRPIKSHPARTVVIGFGGAVLFGTFLLSLPFATAAGESAGLVTALFTATSAVCVTGLSVVDTGTYWSLFGELAILGLMQIGGLGIMTLASLLALIVSRRLGLRMQLTAQAETRALGIGDVRGLIIRVITFSLLFELVVAVILAARLMLRYDQPLTRAIYHGVFHSIAAFTNGSFSLYPDSMVRFVTDAWICLPLAIAVIIGGIGFPVIFELRRRWRTPRRWSLHTKITLWVSAVLLIGGAFLITVIEWANPATLGPLGVPGKLLAGFFHGTVPRTAGFNSVDVGQMHPETLLITDVLMFIGGGSASTAGGIKVTTFALLAFVLIAEIRGEPSVHVMGRRLSPGTQRQALTVALLSVGVVMSATIVLLIITPFRLDAVLFETISAFGTVGLSAGVTAQLPAACQLIFVLLMFIGRLGPITLASALALRERRRRYELPEERPIVG